MNINDFKQIKQFVYIVSRQSNNRHLSWMTQFKNRCQTEITEAMGQDAPALMRNAITQLNTAVAKEDETYLLPTYKALSEQIAELDKQRDKKYNAAKQMAQALVNIGTGDQPQYAQDLLAEIEHYRVDTSAGYAEESTQMNQLIQELLTQEWQTKLTALGLKATFDDLSALNTQMQQLIDERNDALSQIPAQAMQTARAASDEAYALTVMVVNAHAITQYMAGQSPYDTFVGHVNQDQDYYVNHVFPKDKLKKVKITDDIYFYFSGNQSWAKAIEEYPEDNEGWTTTEDAEVYYGEQRLLDAEGQPVDATKKPDVEATYQLEPEPQPEPEPEPDDQGGGDVTPVTPEGV